MRTAAARSRHAPGDFGGDHRAPAGWRGGSTPSASARACRAGQSATQRSSSRRAATAEKGSSRSAPSSTTPTDPSAAIASSRTTT